MNHVSTYTNIFKADIDQYIYIYILYIYIYIHIYTYIHMDISINGGTMVYMGKSY